ncbi:MAG: hypothetical protein RLZZ293_10 [Pseudomonadota bacterium]
MFRINLLLISLGLINLVSGQTDCNLLSKSQNPVISLAQNHRSLATINPQVLKQIDQQINHDIESGLSGAALLIIKDGRIVKSTVYGYSLRYNSDNTLSKEPQPLQCNSLFDLASNSKMYATNYAIMQLVSQGKLNLDRPIHDYIPEYQGCDSSGECRESRLVRDLLTHSAGYMPDPQFFNPATISQYGNNLYSQNRNLTESIILTRLPFVAPRGGKPNYSDVDFMLLGILVEHITQQRLDQYLIKNIYQPLGLRNTLYNPLANGVNISQCAATEINGNTRGETINFPNIRHNILQCQVHDEKAWYSMGGIAGHAGLFSNLADMAILIDSALNNGQYGKVRLWSESVEQEFIAPSASNDTYGLGWRRAGSSPAHYSPFGHYASSRAFGHTGWTGTLTLIDPEYNLAIVLLTNKKHSPYIHGAFIADSLATSQYATIVDLIYQSFLPKQK